MTLPKIFAVGYTACNQVQIYVGGFGRHQYYLTSEQLVVVEKSNVAVNIFLAASFFFSRASICVLLLRVVQKVWLWRWILYGLLVLDAMVGIGTILVYAFLCVPLDKTWYPEKVGHCMAFSTLDKSATVFAGNQCFFQTSSWICLHLCFFQVLVRLESFAAISRQFS